MSERIPAEVFPVQVHIADEMEARGWSLFDLSCMSGLALETIIVPLMDHHVRLDTIMAIRLALAFGTTPEFWRNLDAAYWQWFDAQEVTGDE